VINGTTSVHDYTYTEFLAICIRITSQRRQTLTSASPLSLERSPAERGYGSTSHIAGGANLVNIGLFPAPA